MARRIAPAHHDVTTVNGGTLRFAHPTHRQFGLHSRHVTNHQKRRRHRRRSRRPDGGRSARAGRRCRHRLRRDAVGRPQIPDGGARRAQPHPQRAVAAIPCALRRGDAASASCDRGVSAAGFARLERSAGAADLCRLQRPGVSQRPSRRRPCCAHGCGGSTRMGVRFALRHRWTGWDERGPSALSDAAMDRAPSKRARPCWRSVAQAGRGSDRMVHGPQRLAAKGVQVSPLRPANCGFTVAWSDVFRDRFEGQPLKGVALTFGAHTVRGEAIVTRTGIEGGAVYALSAELREAIAARWTRRRCMSPCGPISTVERSDRETVGAEGQAIALELPAQGRESVTGRDRPAAGGRQGIRRCRYRRCRRLISPALINAVPVAAHRCRADRARDLDRGRHCVRRNRRRFHAPPLARRVRRRRNARLGSADRRLSAAGVVRDGSCGGTGAR